MAKHILAVIDFSKISDEVVARAGELAGFYNAKCWLIQNSPSPIDSLQINSLKFHRENVFDSSTQSPNCYPL